MDAQASVHGKCESNYIDKHFSCKPRARSQQAAGPTPAELYIHKGLALYHASMYDEAINTFNTTLGLDSVTGSLRAFGNALCSMLLMPTFFADSSRYVATASRGLCYFYQGKLEEAIADLSAAIEHNVANEQMFSTRATAYQLLGKDDLAQADRKMALVHDPHAVVKVRFFFPGGAIYKTHFDLRF